MIDVWWMASIIVELIDVILLKTVPEIGAIHRGGKLQSTPGKNIAFVECELIVYVCI